MRKPFSAWSILRFLGLGHRRRGSKQPHQQRYRRDFRVEFLEPRVFLSGGPGGRTVGQQRDVGGVAAAQGRG